MDGCVGGMIGTLTYPSYEHNDPSGRILALVTLNVARRRGIGHVTSSSDPCGAMMGPASDDRRVSCHRRTAPVRRRHGVR